MKKSKLFIGTSGWVYRDWEDSFYPKSLAASNRLSYYSNFFNTTEINSSFYHLPRTTTYENWAKQVSGNFIFSVKVSRFITHIKRLARVKRAWVAFISRAKFLKKSLVLFFCSFQAVSKLQSKIKKD